MEIISLVSLYLVTFSDVWSRVTISRLPLAEVVLQIIVNDESSTNPSSPPLARLGPSCGFVVMLWIVVQHRS